MKRLIKESEEEMELCEAAVCNVKRKKQSKFSLRKACLIGRLF